MIKNSSFQEDLPEIPVIMLVGCVSDERAVVDIKKQPLWPKKQSYEKKREKEKLAEERNKKKAKDYKLADEQILHLSGGISTLLIRITGMPVHSIC